MSYLQFNYSMDLRMVEMLALCQWWKAQSPSGERLETSIMVCGTEDFRLDRSHGGSSLSRAIQRNTPSIMSREIE